MRAIHPLGWETFAVDMRYTLTIPLPLVAFSIVCCSSTSNPRIFADYAPDYSADLPTKLDFSIKNGAGDTLILHYFFGKVFVTERIAGDSRSFEITPSNQDWSSFWTAMDGVNIWEWNSSVDPEEPVFWTFEGSHGTREVQMSGTHFNRGVNGGLSNGREGWNIFAQALEKLISHDSKLL